MTITNASYHVDLDDPKLKADFDIALTDDKLREQKFEFSYLKNNRKLEQTTIWSACDISFDIAKICSDLHVTAAALQSSNSESLTVAFFRGTSALFTNDKYRIIAADCDEYLGEIIFRDSRYRCIYGQKKSYRSYMCMIKASDDDPSVIFIEKNGLIYMKDRINRLLLS